MDLSDNGGEARFGLGQQHGFVGGGTARGSSWACVLAMDPRAQDAGQGRWLVKGGERARLDDDMGRTGLED